VGDLGGEARIFGDPAAIDEQRLVAPANHVAVGIEAHFQAPSQRPHS